MKRFAALAACIAFSSGAGAQTLGFDVDTVAGRYVADMLSYAGVEIVDCLSEVPKLPTHIEDYLCVEDMDDVPFVDDVDRYLETRSGIVKESSGWYSVNSSMSQHIIMNDGYEVTLVTDPTTNFVMVLGDTLHYAYKDTDHLLLPTGLTKLQLLGNPCMAQWLL